ncbi:MAG: MFS transporter [Chloroflexi bacterium]|nr:MFS transporter [Chloroflexota bacterium]
MRNIHYAWYVVAATFSALLLAAGARSTFGVFVIPLEGEFKATRADVALVASLSILVNGVNQPIMGHLLDRYGVRRVAIICLAVGAAGLMVSSLVTGLWQMYITFSVVVSIAAGGPASTMAMVVATRWFSKNRGLVMGLLSAGHSAGQVILIPVAMQLNLAFGWRMTYVLLGIGIVALLVPIGMLIRSDPSDKGLRAYGASEAGAITKAQAQEAARKTPLNRAVRSHTFWMLAIGFFTCGFTGQGTVATHLVAYTVQRGIEPTVAATALGVAGGVSALGTILTGYLTDHIGRKTPLGTVYFIRGVAIFLLLFVDEPIRLFLFAIVYGLGSFATVPPTSAITAHTFGRASQGIIYGTISSIHQIGGALGSYTGGLLFDLTGTYQTPFLMAAALCFIAATASFSINEQPLKSPTPAGVQV